MFPDKRYTDDGRKHEAGEYDLFMKEWFYVAHVRILEYGAIYV